MLSLLSTLTRLRRRAALKRVQLADSGRSEPTAKRREREIHKIHKTFTGEFGERWKSAAHAFPVPAMETRLVGRCNVNIVNELLKFCFIPQVLHNQII